MSFGSIDESLKCEFVDERALGNRVCGDAIDSDEEILRQLIDRDYAGPAVQRVPVWRSRLDTVRSQFDFVLAEDGTTDTRLQGFPCTCSGELDHTDE